MASSLSVANIREISESFLVESCFDQRGIADVALLAAVELRDSFPHLFSGCEIVMATV